jgi:ABC-type uncharacterized transport system permease subunit
LAVTANVVPISLILVSMMIVAMDITEITILTRTTRHRMPEDGIHKGPYITQVIILNALPVFGNKTPTLV